MRNRHQHVDCVLVDQAQFLTPKQVLQLTLICDQIGISVLCYGLELTFGASHSLGACTCLLGELVEIKTVCYSGRER